MTSIAWIILFCAIIAAAIWVLGDVVLIERPPEGVTP